MSEKYTIKDLRYIAEDMVEMLRDYEDGTVTTTGKMAYEAGYEDLEISDLLELHKSLFRAATANHIKLEISDHVDCADIQPYVLEYTVKNKKAQIKCPYCGSTNTARYIYGYTIVSDEMKKKVYSGKWILCDCMVNSVKIGEKEIINMPKRKCLYCKENFATEPILIEKEYNTAEDYRDIVTSVKFSIGGYFGGFTDITIKKNEKGASVSVQKTRDPDESYSDRQITPMKWKKIVNKLYGQMYLHEWKKDYVDNSVMDGTQWNLVISLKGKRPRSYGGSNDYPPYWKELIKIFREYVKINRLESPTGMNAAI